MHKKYLYTLLSLCFAQLAHGQIYISGSVLTDKDSRLPVRGVRIHSSGGNNTYTNDSGTFVINLQAIDTIQFFYKERLIDAYPFSYPSSPRHYLIYLDSDTYFNQDAHKLEDVTVQARNYLNDSLKNRKDYAGIYNYKKPKLGAGDNRWSESVSFMGEKQQVNTMDKKYSLLDIGTLANVLSFKHKKRQQRYQRFAIENEQQSYIDHRFTENFVEKYSGIHQQDSLNLFMREYRPSYKELIKMSDFDIARYITNKATLFNKK